MRYLHSNVVCICGSKCRTIVNTMYYLAVYTSKNSQNAAYFFPNSSQGPFPKTTGKGPGMMTQTENKSTHQSEMVEQGPSWPSFREK